MDQAGNQHHRHYLRYWSLGLETFTGSDVTSVADVIAEADAVAAAYQEADFGSYPGLTLIRGVDGPGGRPDVDEMPEDSLGICVAPPHGWAIFRTKDYYQVITHSDRELDGQCR